MNLRGSALLRRIAEHPEKEESPSPVSGRRSGTTAKADMKEATV
jgi:hypothetical protein